MRIVHIVDYFHPNAGYQLNVLSKYIVKEGHEDYIIAGELDKIPVDLTVFFGRDNIDEYDKAFTAKTGVKIIRLPLVAYISGRGIFRLNLQKTVDDLKPDILFVHDIDTFAGMQFVRKLSKLNYPVVFNSTMLEMASANPLRIPYRWFYRTFITPKIKKHNVKIIRIQDDPYLEQCLGIPLSQCPFISVGSDTMLFHPNDSVKSKIRQKHNISDNDFVVIYTGKLNEAKGAGLLAKAFKDKLQNRKNRKVVLLVVGNTSGGYGQEIETLFKQSENRIIRFPTQKYMELAQLYQTADLSVFPKECSLSFYDAQACGLPVVSEDNNVNIGRLQFNNGFNFKAGDLGDFRAQLIKCIEMPSVDFRQMSENAYNFVKENYDYADIAKKYLDVIINEYNKFHGMGSK